MGLMAVSIMAVLELSNLLSGTKLILYMTSLLDTELLELTRRQAY